MFPLIASTHFLPTSITGFIVVSFFILYILNRVKQNHEIVLICIPKWLKMLDIKNIHFIHILYDMECFFCYYVHISILSESCTFIGISFLWFWKPYNIFENIFCVFFSFFFLLYLQFIGCYLYSVLQLKHIQVIFFFISLFLISKFIFPLSDTISTELLFHLFF